MPTMGTQLGLRVQGVEAPLEVVAVTIRAQADGPGIRQPDADVFTCPEPLDGATLARAGGWRNVETAKPFMQTPSTGSPGRSGRICTPEPGRLCPVCRKVRLRGRQSVCSGRCRVDRWRNRQAETRDRRDREVRGLLARALARLERL
jgi:hypothetical protein